MRCGPSVCCTLENTIVDGSFHFLTVKHSNSEAPTSGPLSPSRMKISRWAWLDPMGQCMGRASTSLRTDA